MVSVRDKADTEVLRCLQLARFEDILTDELDILCGRRDIASLTSCAVLDEDEVSVEPTVSSDRDFSPGCRSTGH